MSKKKETVPYSTIPIVPKDFDGANGVAIEAAKGIDFWREQKAAALFEDQRTHAQQMIKAWRQAKSQADATMQSYQLKLL